MKRRTYGEGSIIKKVRRGKTYFVAQISHVEYGRRRYREKWCRDETEARRELRKLKAARAQGKQVFGERMTVADWVDHWLESRKSNVAPQTAMDYDRVVRLHIKPFLGRLALVDYSADAASDLYKTLRARKRSTAAVRSVHKVLHKALADAVRARRIDRNPLDDLDPPRHRYAEVEPYTLEELRRFLKAARGHRFEALWVLAIFSQAREGELFTLRWRDVDLEAGAIFVMRGLQDVDYSQRRIADPKANSRRRLDLPPIAVESLARARAAAERRPGFRVTDLAFPDARGGPLRRQNLLRRHLYPMLDEAELRRLHFHAIRHSGATLLAELIPLVALSERLGHKSIKTTADVYVHRSRSMQRLAADRLDELFPAEAGLGGGRDGERVDKVS